MERDLRRGLTSCSLRMRFIKLTMATVCELVGVVAELEDRHGLEILGRCSADASDSSG